MHLIRSDSFMLMLSCLSKCMVAGQSLDVM